MAPPVVPPRQHRKRTLGEVIVIVSSDHEHNNSSLVSKGSNSTSPDVQVIATQPDIASCATPLTSRHKQRAPRLLGVVGKPQPTKSGLFQLGLGAIHPVSYPVPTVDRSPPVQRRMKRVPVLELSSDTDSDFDLPPVDVLIGPAPLAHPATSTERALDLSTRETPPPPPRPPPPLDQDRWVRREAGKAVLLATEPVAAFPLVHEPLTWLLPAVCEADGSSPPLPTQRKRPTSPFRPATPNELSQAIASLPCMEHLKSDIDQDDFDFTSRFTAAEKGKGQAVDPPTPPPGEFDTESSNPSGSASPEELQPTKHSITVKPPTVKASERSGSLFELIKWLVNGLELTHILGTVGGHVLPPVSVDCPIEMLKSLDHPQQWPSRPVIFDTRPVMLGAPSVFLDQPTVEQPAPRKHQINPGPVIQTSVDPVREANQARI